MAIENENLTSVSATETEVNGAQYIEALNQLKQNSVSKEDYMKLKQENKQLLNSLVQGTSIENPSAEKKAVVSTDDLIKKYDELSNGQASNLEYWETTLALRNRLIEEGRQDPFLPAGHNYVIQQSDVDSANKVATVVQECIDYADGDPSVFTNELQRRTNDVRINRR